MKKIENKITKLKITPNRQGIKVNDEKIKVMVSRDNITDNFVISKRDPCQTSTCSI